jgi:hypothetical protein
MSLRRRASRSLARMRDRLGDEYLLGCEMAIEAAAGQAGLLHDSIDADAIEAVLVEQAPRRLHEPLVVFRLTV